MRRTLIPFILALISLAITAPVQSSGAAPLGIGELRSLALSPDGSRLAAGTAAGVYFYDAHTFAPLHHWPTAYAIEDIQWPHNGHLIAILGGGRLEVREVASGGLLWQAPAPTGRTSTASVPTKFGDYWRTVEVPPSVWTLTPDGSALANLRSDGLHLYHAHDGSLRGSLPLDGISAHSVAFSPSGQQVVLCCEAGTARMQVRDLNAWQVLFRPASDRPRSANHIAWTPDDSLLVVGNATYRVDVWDGHTQWVRAQIYQYGGRGGLAISPDGRWLAVSSGPKVQLWRVGQWDGSQRILDAHDYEFVAGWRNDFHDLAWSPDSRTLYTAVGDSIRAWDTLTGERLRQLDEFTRRFDEVAWSADGSQVLAVEDGNAYVWDVNSGQPLPLPDPAFVKSVTSPRGDVSAATGRRGVALYDATTRAFLHRLYTGHRISGVAFSPDGVTIATFGHSPYVLFWDVASGRALGQLLADRNPDIRRVIAVEYSGDGKTLYTLAETGALQAWDVAGAALREATHLPTTGPCQRYCEVRAVYLDWARRLAVTSEYLPDLRISRLHVIDPAAGSVRYSIEGVAGYGLAVNTQRTRMAQVLGGNRAIGVWDLESGQQVAEFGGQARVTVLEFSPDGRRLASGHADGTVRVWNVP